MKTITIYGASDDLIEIEGDICDEFNALDLEGGKIAISDGTLLSIEYSKDGIWRINRLVTGFASMEKVEGTDDDNYSDRVTLTGDIQWVLLGTDCARIKTGAYTADIDREAARQAAGEAAAESGYSAEELEAIQQEDIGDRMREERE